MSFAEPRIEFHTYGKTDVRLTQVTHPPEGDRVMELSCSIRFEGEFEESYTSADNRRVLPTDTMKNSVYAVARRHPIQTIERFGCDLAAHFLDGVANVERVRIEILQRPWLRLSGRGALMSGGEERRYGLIRASRNGTHIASGIRNLEILKTQDSAFSGFLQDEWTTLPETRDRLLGTVLEATWHYNKPEIDYDTQHDAVRSILLATFARHRSESVQHTLYAMSSETLAQIACLSDIHLVMPNKHRLLVNLERFGMDNPNQIFVPIDEPSGYIEARLVRTGS